MASLLLVDDNLQLLDFYKLVLEQAGHEVRTAGTRGHAAEILVEMDPEIVVLDLRMPELEDGLGLIRLCRSHTHRAAKRPLKIVVTSGWVEDLLETAEKDMVDCVLPKPVHLEVLLRSIAELVLGGRNQG